MPSVREVVIGVVRRRLRVNANLDAYEITADKIDYDTSTPYITISIARGGLTNTDSFQDVDVPVFVRVHGTNLKELYSVYGSIENQLTNVMLPDYEDWKFYAPVRLLDMGYVETFKKSQHDFYTIGCTVRIRGVYNGN